MRKRLLSIFVLSLCLSAFLNTSAQSLLKEGKIPKDLIMGLTESYGGGGWDQTTIKSDGTILFDSYSNMPKNGKTFLDLLKLAGGKTKDQKTKLETPKPNSKLSRKQLKKLVLEFEKVDIFNFPNRTLTSKDGCTNESIINGGRGISIFIQVNGKMGVASIDGICTAAANTRAEKFTNLINKISEVLKEAMTKSSK